MVNVWTLRPNEKENHWFDGIVGAAVAANELGATRPEFYVVNSRRLEPISFFEASKAAAEEGSSVFGTATKKKAPNNGNNNATDDSINFWSASKNALEF